MRISSLQALLIAVLVWLAGPATRGQDCLSLRASPPVSVGPTDLANPWTIHKRVDEVVVFFTVTEGHKFVSDLTEQDVKVRDDNKRPPQISAFARQSDLPLKLGLLIDTSNSVHYRFRFEQESAARFLQTILRPKWDRAFVMGFSQVINLTQDYTDDTYRLARGVFALSSEGGTALFDAVREACRKLVDDHEAQPTARILVVLSDGDDNASKSTLEQVIDSAQRREVTIYTISTGNSLSGMGEKILKKMAVQSGGQLFIPGSPQEVVKAFRSIEQEMRSRYALSYHPAELREDGRFHRIEIIAQRLNRKFRVRARRGYYAPLAASAD